MKEEIVELRKVRDFGEIISDSFVFVRQNLKPILAAFFVICGFFIVASAAADIVQQTKLMQFVNTYGSSTDTYQYSSPWLRLFTWSALVSSALALLTYSSITICMLSFIVLYVEKGNNPPTVEEVWGYFKFYFWRAVGSGIVVAIAVIVAFVMCVVPGFLILPAFSMIVPIIVLENSSLGYAYNRSFQLVRGYYWTVFGVIFIMGIIVSVASAIFVMPVSIITTGSALVSGHKLTYLSIVLNAITAHIAIVFQILSPIAVAICYYSLTEIKESTGLLSRIDKLGETTTGESQATEEEY